jgi:hypothetical protein
MMNNKHIIFSLVFAIENLVLLKIIFNNSTKAIS